MQAMILAAGFGTRLRPYSLEKPKPLFPVLNRPLLQATIERLQTAGFTKIVVNCHHLREHIIEAVYDYDVVILQEEEHILGTGGGLRQAVARLDDSPLLVTNGDIYHTIDAASVYNSHLKNKSDVTMVLHDYPRFNNVAVSDGRIVGFSLGGMGERWMAFTGLQVVNPEVLELIEPGRQSSIIDHYRDLISDGRVVGYQEVADTYWCDMGSPADYLELHAGLLTGIIPAWTELAYDAAKEPILIDGDAQFDTSCKIKPWACIGKASLGAGAEISRSVIWDGAVIKPSSVISDMIITPRTAP